VVTCSHVTSIVTEYKPHTINCCLLTVMIRTHSKLFQTSPGRRAGVLVCLYN